MLSYYLFIESLKDLLIRNSNSRIINVASNYAGDYDFNDLQFNIRSYESSTVYRQTKQCNRMLTWAAHDMFFANTTTTVNACHPGVVTSPLLQSLGNLQWIMMLLSIEI